MLKKTLRMLGDSYIRRRNRQEFEEQRFTRTNERPIEYSYAFRQLNRLQPRTVLDIGTGKSALPSLLRTCGFVVTAVDNVTDYWTNGMLNRHYHIIDDDIRNPSLSGPFDAVLCISTLEHIREHSVAVQNMLGLTRPGGHLIITSPYNEWTYHPNVYEDSNAAYGHDLPYSAQSFSRVELNGWLDNGPPVKIVDQEYWRCFTGKLWTLGELLRPPERADSPNEPHQLSCMTLKRLS